MRRIKNFLDHIDQLNERKVLLYIFGISIIIRLLYVIFMPTIVHGDAVHYNDVAIGLIEGKGYEGGVGSFNPPGYPFFLAAIYYVFGYNLQIACIFQAFFSSLTCIIIYYIGKTVLNKKIGIISALIASFYPIFIIYSSYLITETLFIFLLCLSIFYLLKVHEEPSVKNLLITGILLGLTTLTRNVIIGFIPFILFWMLLSSKERKKNLMRFVAIIVIMMVVVSPWTIRNYNVHNDFVLVSPNGGVNLWMGNNPEATGKPWFENTTNNPLYNITNQVERNKIGYEKAFEFIRENPSKFLILGAKKFACFWGFITPFFSCYLHGYFINPIPGWLFMLLAPLTVIPYAIVLPLAIFGIIFYQKWDKKSSLLLLLILYFTLLHSIVIASTRYHMPLVPLLIIFAAYGACSLNRVRSEIKSGNVNTKKIILFFISMMILIVSWHYSTFYYYSDEINALIGKLVGG